MFNSSLINTIPADYTCQLFLTYRRDILILRVPGFFIGFGLSPKMSEEIPIKKFCLTRTQEHE